MGFCCKDRLDFDDHNPDYFKTAIELGRLAKQKNWFVVIKPRQDPIKMHQFFKTHPWTDLYRDAYFELHNNPNIFFVKPTHNHIYDYYCADSFVFNGCSTGEIEVSAIQKPLVVVRTSPNSSPDKYDPYDTVNSGVATFISDVADLEAALMKPNDPQKQKALLDKMGILFDGKHAQRIQERLLK
jgi:hypothetical protein